MPDIYNIPEMPGDFAGDHPVAAATNIGEGAMVALNAAGNAVQAASAITGHVIGKAVSAVENPGAIGDKTVRIQRGVFSLALDSTNPPNKSHVGGIVGFTAPDTVSSVLGTCRGGILIGFDEKGRALVDLTVTTKTAGL
jgi:hypothetical protein